MQDFQKIIQKELSNEGWELPLICSTLSDTIAFAVELLDENQKENFLEATNKIVEEQSRIAKQRYQRIRKQLTEQIQAEIRSYDNPYDYFIANFPFPPNQFSKNELIQKIFFEKQCQESKSLAFYIIAKEALKLAK